MITSQNPLSVCLVGIMAGPFIIFKVALFALHLAPARVTLLLASLPWISWPNLNEFAKHATMQEFQALQLDLAVVLLVTTLGLISCPLAIVLYGDCPVRVGQLNRIFFFAVRYLNRSFNALSLSLFYWEVIANVRSVRLQ